MKKNNVDRYRLIAILFVSICVILTGILYITKAISSGDIWGAITSGIIIIIILAFALFAYRRGNEDLKRGFPLKDERSVRVLEKASSKAFYVSLYLLLLVGFLSDNILRFRDISQATGIMVGFMGLLFLTFWAYYNRKEL